MNLEDVKQAGVLIEELKGHKADIKLLNSMCKDLVKRDVRHSLKNSFGIYTEKTKDPKSPTPQNIQEKFKEYNDSGRPISVGDVLRVSQEMSEAETPLFKFEEYLDDNEVLEVITFVLKMKIVKVRKINAELKSLGIEK